MNLKRQAFVGSVWSLLSNGGRQVISFSLFIFIARNLTPADIGLVALAMILIDIAGFASRFGQVEALQRQPDLTDRLVNTSFWMLAIGGPVTSVLIIAGAATFGGAATTHFQTVLILLAPLCTLQAWNAIPEALLKRRFDYRSLAARTWLATLAGGIVGVFLAVNGFGVYALVGQRVANALVQTLTIWAMLKWHPRMEFSRDDARELLRVGFGVMLANSTNVVNKRVVDGIVGSVLGVTELGHFYLGWRFFDFIVQFAVTPVTSVALSMFSTVQHNREMIIRIYLRLSQFVALASLPVFFGLAVIADLLVPVVLGSKWKDSIVVMQFLGFIMLAGTVNFFFASAMIAVGQMQIIARQATAQIIATAVLVFVGAHFGIIGVLLAIIARAWMLAVYNLTALRKVLGLSIAALLRTLMPPVVATGIMVGAVQLAKQNLAGLMAPPLLLASLIVIGAIIYGAVLILGDLAGLWRGYIRGAIESLMGAISTRSASAPTMRPALAVSKGERS